MLAQPPPALLQLDDEAIRQDARDKENPQVKHRQRETTGEVRKAPRSRKHPRVVRDRTFAADERIPDHQYQEARLRNHSAGCPYDARRPLCIESPANRQPVKQQQDALADPHQHRNREQEQECDHAVPLAPHAQRGQILIDGSRTHLFNSSAIPRLPGEMSRPERIAPEEPCVGLLAQKGLKVPCPRLRRLLNRGRSPRPASAATRSRRSARTRRSSEPPFAILPNTGTSGASASIAIDAGPLGRYAIPTEQLDPHAAIRLLYYIGRHHQRLARPHRFHAGHRPARRVRRAGRFEDHIEARAATPLLLHRAAAARHSTSAGKRTAGSPG
jgi:hypothetical protein